jgi:hypothetical protein
MSGDDDVKALVRSRILALHRQVMETGDLAASEASREIGLDESYRSKLASGKRASVGLETLSHVMLRTGLRAEYFFDATLGDDPDFREYAAEGPPTYAAIDAACRSLGVELTQERYRWLREGPDFHRMTPMRAARALREWVSGMSPEQKRAKDTATEAARASYDGPRRQRG